MNQRKYSKKELTVAAAEHINEREYWLKKLGGLLKPCHFPRDYKHENNHSSANELFQYDENILNRLMWLSSDSDHAAHMILIAAITVLLHRYTGTNDIIIGTPIYKQEIEGEFINTVLPIRMRLTPEITFKELVKQVATSTTEAVENQNYPMEILSEQLEWEEPEAPVEDPLWQTLLLLESLHDRDYINHLQPGMFFFFSKQENALNGGVEYNELLFDKKTIHRMVSHLKNILALYLFESDKSINSEEIIEEEEKKWLLCELNNTTTDYPREKTLHQLFEEQAEKHSHHMALVAPQTFFPSDELKNDTVDSELNGLQLTYRELNCQANQLAWILKKRGVGADIFVGILIERSIEMMVGILGILKSGGAYLPIDGGFPVKRVNDMLSDANARILITMNDLVKKYSFTTLQGISYSNLPSEVIVTSVRPQILNFEAIPLPNRSLVNYEFYNQYIGQSMAKHTISIQATRGCPYKCAYCHKIWPKHHVFRSAAHIFQEIKLYYEMGIRRFAFIDDIFNLNMKNSRRLFEMIVDAELKIQIFFPNGVRGDLLNKEYIDLMIKAGTINMAFALETASPRLQKLIGKNLNLPKFRENIEYICKTYPQVIIELFTMHGYPSETIEEARMTLDFIKSIKWLHFPYVFILKVYPNTDMEKLALENGVTREEILASMDRAYHELPDTLPFDTRFTLKYQAEFTNEYFLSKERLLHVLPHQINALTEEELVQKYNSYLPVEIRSLQDLLNFVGISKREFTPGNLLDENYWEASDLNNKMKIAFAKNELSGKEKEIKISEVATKGNEPLRILLLDLSQYFTSDSDLLSDLIEPPLGLIYLLTYLQHKLGNRVNGRIAKSMIDFDNYEELKKLVEEFKPHLIGIRTLSLYKDFFHTTVSMIRRWGIEVPIIAGGPYATSAYHAILQDSNINLVILGEGELTLTELVEKMLDTENCLPKEDVLNGIAGIAFLPKITSSYQTKARDLILLDQFRQQHCQEYDENPTPVNHSNHLAYSIFTSGSTGQPKGILTSHTNAVRVVTATNYVQLDETHRLLQLSNYAFDGSIFDIYGALCNGGTLVLINKEEVLHLEKLVEIIKRQAINVFFVTTALFNALVEIEPESLFYVKKILFGGERVSMSHTQRALQVMGENKILHMYGPTETTVYATYYPIQQIGERWETIPIGIPLANTTVYILDQRYALIPVGVTGELFVGGDGVARGYMNNPELTEEKFYPILSRDSSRENRLLGLSKSLLYFHSSTCPLNNSTIYRSGDLARWQFNGNIEFVGRVDHQVKIRGFRIELGEIENHLLTQPEIKEAVVLVKAEPTSGYSLVAYIVLKAKNNTDVFDVNRLKNNLSFVLPEYMIPATIIPLQQIPLSINGKIDRRALEALESEQKSLDYVPPASPVEERLVQIWSEVLKIEPHTIGVETDFFELGGHSLRVTILATRINKEFKVEIPMENMFSKPTIRAMAEFIQEAAKDKQVVIRVVEKKEYYKLSSAQKRLFFLEQFEDIGISYHVTSVYTLEGKLDKERLSNALQGMIFRHETLRTSFFYFNDKPVQRIHEIEDVQFNLHELTPLERETGDESLKEMILAFVKPFNLARAPLMQVAIIPMAADRHVLVFDAHHIIYDGSSLAIITKEFASLYSGEKLLPLEIQYKDYSEWQQNSMECGQLKEQETYWLTELGGELPVLKLPTDYPRPVMQSYEGNRIYFELNLQDSTGMKQLAREENATLFMVLLSVFNILITKLSGQEDFFVGVPIAGRQHSALYSLVGMFVNSLVIRNTISSEKSFRSLFREVRQNALKAFENQDYQFEELVDKLRIPRDTSRNPLFDIKFVLQNIETHPLEIPGLKFIPNSLENYTTKFDLSMDAFEIQDKIVFSVEYCTRLFRKESIERFTAYFQEIVKCILMDSERPISQINIVSDADKKEILETFNFPEVPYPREKVIHHLLEDQVQKTPDTLALISGEENLSYSCVEAKANQLAHFLLNKINVRIGEPVGVLMERSSFLIPVIQGILKAGTVYLPLHVSVPEERLKYIIADTGTSMVISQKKYLRILNRLHWSCPVRPQFLCVDSKNIALEDEMGTGGLMDTKLWDYVGESGEDEIAVGGWYNSFDGAPFTPDEMEEYSQNILAKLSPLLNQQCRVLEIGCSSGITMFRLSPYVEMYFGTDLSVVSIEKTKKQVSKMGITNVTLQCVPAHQIEQIEEKDFDLIVINSVIHCFPGHNYLEKVIGKCVNLLKEKGHIFLGDIIDLELKKELVTATTEFKLENSEKGFKTKTDWSSELFLSREYLEQLSTDFPPLRTFDYSRKIFQTENELTKYRYDVLIQVDKSYLKDESLKTGIGRYKFDGGDLENQPSNKPGIPLSPKELAYIIYTSGSTGVPKGTMIEHSPVINRLNWMQKSYPLTHNDVIMQKTTLIFDVSIWELFWWLIPGASLFLLEPEGEKNPETIIKMIEKQCVSVLHFVPSMLGMFLEFVKENRSEKRLQSLKRVFASGEALLHNHVEVFNQLLFTPNSTTLVNLYGPTEATVDVSYYNDVFNLPWESIPIGKPIDNIQLLIFDENNQLTPVGVPGELCIAGVGLARGYLNHPELTADKFCILLPDTSFQDNPPLAINKSCSAFHSTIYQTGDLARWMSDGNIQFLGRIDQQVKIRGFRIELGEIENRLLKRPDISAAVVVIGENQEKSSGTESDGGKYLCAYLVMRGKSSFNRKEIREDLSRELPMYMIPDYFVLIEQIPLTATGKLDRFKLPPPRYEQQGELIELPANDIETGIVELWSNLLDIEPGLISTSNNFFELGGHSLKATILMSRIHKEFHVKVPLTIIFKHPTVKGLANYIKQSSQGRYNPIQSISPKDVYVLSSAQKRLFTLQQMDQESTSYNLAEIVILEGIIDIGKVEGTLRLLIQRHESLRTSFELKELEPVQRIHKTIDFAIKLSMQKLDSSSETEEEKSISFSSGMPSRKDVFSEFVRPFDLSVAPLLRVELVQVDSQHHLLMMDMHHIISDGISINIFIREFMALYKGETLPPLPIQYKEYAEWQNDEKQKESMKKQEEYWLSVYSGTIPQLELPSDNPRPIVKNYMGQRMKFDIGKEERDSLNQLALEENATLYMVLLAALNILLFRLSGQEDIVVGTAVSGRHHADLHGVIGMFVNTLAMRNYPNGNHTFHTFLKEISENTLKAFENQDYQFEELVNKLGIKRSSNRHPLFEVGFGLENFEISTLDIPGIFLKPYNTQHRISKFDISLVGTDSTRGIYFKCEYSTELFRPETMEMFVNNFKSIITAILKDRDIHLEDIQLSHELLAAKTEVPGMELEF